MAKISGLMSTGRIGKADQKVVDAMPDAPLSAALDSSAQGEEDNGRQYSGPVRDSGSLASSLPLDSSVLRSASFEIAASLIRPSPYQVRAVADGDYIETLMASIAQSGVISPLVVRMLDSSTYEVIAGHHRLEACRRLGYFNVPVVIRNMTDPEAACALASDNFVRKELSDYERFKHAKLLRDHEFCRTNGEIGQVLGISRQLVGFLFSFEDYPPETKAILETHPNILGATQANDLKDLAREQPEYFTEAIVLLSQDRLRQNQIRGWIESKNKSATVRMQNRQEIKISKPELKSVIKLTFTDREAKIQAEGLNIEKLKRLIEENLQDLIRN